MAAHRAVPVGPDVAQFVDDASTLLPWLMLLTLALLAAVTT